MKTSQIEKIIHFSKDGEFHCQVEYWDNYIRSPHKRREEIEKEGIYHFETRPCIHGHKGSYDYKMIPIIDSIAKEPISHPTASQDVPRYTNSLFKGQPMI